MTYAFSVGKKEIALLKDGVDTSRRQLELEDGAEYTDEDERSRTAQYTEPAVLTPELLLLLARTPCGAQLKALQHYGGPQAENHEGVKAIPRLLEVRPITA